MISIYGTNNISEQLIIIISAIKKKPQPFIVWPKIFKIGTLFISYWI